MAKRRATFSWQSFKHRGLHSPKRHRITTSGVPVGEDAGLCSEKGWDELPTVLIWMIMERSHVTDNLRLAAVCKHWRQAFQNHPNRFQCSIGQLPWLMFTKRGNNVHVHEREFFCVATQKKYKLCIDQEYSESRKGSSFTLLCSKKGWLLFATTYPGHKPNDNPTTPLFLLNPFNKEKIPLPDVGDIGIKPGEATISTDLGGIPNCVVLAHFADRDALVTLRIAHPGDKFWTTWHYTSNLWNPRDHTNLFISMVGNYVYCMAGNGWILRLDRSNSEWTEYMVTMPWKCLGRFPWFICIFESDGEILLVSPWRVGMMNQMNITDFGFYKLNDDQMAWEAMNESEIRGRCWFLGLNMNGGFSFVAKKKLVSQVYMLYGVGKGMHMNLHDLDHFAGNSKSVLSHLLSSISYLSNVDYHWVDLG